jgi:hypothetical protein
MEDFMIVTYTGSKGYPNRIILTEEQATYLKNSLEDGLSEMADHKESFEIMLLADSTDAPVFTIRVYPSKEKV